MLHFDAKQSQFYVTDFMRHNVSIHPLPIFCNWHLDFLKVCNAYRGSRTDQNTFWWLEALHHAEQNKDFSSALIRKIEEAVSGNSKSSKLAARLVVI